MRLNTKGMDARRSAQPMATLSASGATPQTLFCVQTWRAGAHSFPAEIGSKIWMI